MAEQAWNMYYGMRESYIEPVFVSMMPVIIFAIGWQLATIFAKWGRRFLVTRIIPRISLGGGAESGGPSVARVAAGSKSKSSAKKGG